MQYQQVDTSTPVTETKGYDIVSKINFECDTDYLSYTPDDKVMNVNAAYEELVGEIIVDDGRFEYDDTNHTDQPIGTATLVEGQESYTFSTEYLAILAIEILDKGGTIYRRIKPLDHTQLGGLSPDEYFGVQSGGSPVKGQPLYYDLVGDSIYLYPAPAAVNVTLASGLKVYFQRTVDLFTTTDTTQQPGLPSPYHSILAYMASLDYCSNHKKDRVPSLENKIAVMKQKLLKHYAKRHEDDRHVLRMKPIRHR